MIDVFLFRTDIADGLLAQMIDASTPADQARAARFRRVADRRRHVVARAVLTSLLTDRLAQENRGQTTTSEGRHAVSLVFDIGPHGKPTLAGRDAASLQFNLSHSGDLALIALADVPVGIDLERDTPPDAQALAQAWFTPAEQARMARGDADFLTLWTLREAALKAAGTGLSGEPDFRRYTAAPLALADAVPALPSASIAPYRAAIAVLGPSRPVTLTCLDANDVAARGTLRAAARAGAACPTP